MPESAGPVISNTSPLLYLYGIERLELLEQLYVRVWVPEQVAVELEAGVAGGRRVPDVRSLAWCEVRQVGIPPQLKVVPDLGAGEASTIALALETAGKPLVVLDEALGRRIARLQAVRLTGTAGVLLRAKERRLVPLVRPLLERMRDAGYYLREDHLRLICRLAGEETD